MKDDIVDRVALAIANARINTQFMTRDQIDRRIAMAAILTTLEATERILADPASGECCSVDREWAAMIRRALLP